MRIFFDLVLKYQCFFFFFFCRIGFANNTESVPFDWTLGALIFQSMLEPLESEINNLDEIVGDESVTYFSLFAVLLIALLAAFFVLQLRKPQLKTIYDLEKGRYIVTRVPR
jgi:apyrase